MQFPTEFLSEKVHSPSFCPLTASILTMSALQQRIILFQNLLVNPTHQHNSWWTFWSVHFIIFITLFWLYKSYVFWMFKKDQLTLSDNMTFVSGCKKLWKWESNYASDSVHIIIYCVSCLKNLHILEYLPIYFAFHLKIWHRWMFIICLQLRLLLVTSKT